MTKLQANALLLMLAAVFVALLFLAFNPEGYSGEELAAAPTADTREAIVLNPEQLDYGLAQMRGLLVTVQQIDSANYENDFAELAALSRGEAPGAGRNPPAGFHDASPEGLNVMARQMRQSFARMAQAAQQQDAAAFHNAKQQALSACITCHESYRFVPE